MVGAKVIRAKYRISFEVRTEADPSNLLDKIEQFLDDGYFDDDDYGTGVVPIDGSACVEELSTND